jgi:two-component system chemotaxis sensor kinase CheA
LSLEDEEFLKKLRVSFKVEAAEHLQAITSGLLELENSQETTRRQEVVAFVFREAHSLKGAARTVGANRIEMICQGLESVFALWRREGVTPSAELLDPLHLAVNLVGKFLSSLESGDAEPDVASMIGLLQKLTELASTTPTAATITSFLKPHEDPAQRSPVVATTKEPLHAERNLPFETIRISTAKLDALLVQAEEMLGLKLTSKQRATELRSVRDMFFDLEAQWSQLCSAQEVVGGVAPSSKSNSDSGTGLTVAEVLNWSRAHIRSMEETLSAIVDAADHDRRSIALRVDMMLEDSKKLMMLSFATLFESFPKLVRDLSRDQGKEVELVIRGGEVEIDKRILEEMKDPLVHLLRNSLDHGIEPPQTRVQAKKPARGTIILAVSQVEGNNVQILIEDDGNGIDTAKLREAAVRHGMLSGQEAHNISEDEAVGLAFRSEISTSPMITEISGRGLGLAIVREKVQKIGGRIEVQTRLGGGTSFRVQLPLTLATFRGICVGAAEQQFIVPTSNVERVARVEPKEIRTVENRETILLDGHPVSLVHLSEVLNLRGSGGRAAAAFVPIVVLTANDQRMAFAVTEIMGEQEVLVKRLAKPLVRVKNIAGATILGSGRPMIILNVAELMKSATKAVADSAASSEETNSEEKPRSVLVVEDSITARMLLKNILESAGYKVRTTVDGLEALNTLRTEAFDIVVSDVEMPRMSGFDLTEKIRADENLSDLPVILVTALATQEDRAHGIDVGANAYIVKNSFDQSDLLDAIQRLL